MFSKMLLEMLLFIVTEIHALTADALDELSDAHSIERTAAHRAAACIETAPIVELAAPVYSFLARIARRLSRLVIAWEKQNNPDFPVFS